MRSLGQNPTEAELMDMIQEVSHFVVAVVDGRRNLNFDPEYLISNDFFPFHLYRLMRMEVERLISLNS